MVFYEPRVGQSAHQSSRPTRPIGRTSRLRKNYVGTPVLHWSVRLGQEENTTQGAQKGRPARPQQAKRRGIRFGTLSL